jgi:hypothetical protein
LTTTQRSIAAKRMLSAGAIAAISIFRLQRRPDQNGD